MNELFCPHCAHKHAPGLRFCPNTGKPLPEVQTCPNCGRDVLPDWNICVNCGEQLNRRSPVPRTTPPARRVWYILLFSGLVLVIAGISYLFVNWGENVFGYLQKETLKLIEDLDPLNRFSAEDQHPVEAATPAAEILGRLPASPTLESLASATQALVMDDSAHFTPLSTAIENQITVSAPLTPTVITNSAPAQAASATQTDVAPPTLTPIPLSSVPIGKIVFTCQIFRDPSRNQICLIQADGSGWRRLSTDDHADHLYPSFSPNGQSIVFSLEKGDQQIYEMDIDGKQRQLTNLPFQAYAPAISPDNRWIVFTGNDGKIQTLWLMQRDGSIPSRLINGIDGDAFDPAWSPDSRAGPFCCYDCR
jgi:hypothetical protein